MEWDYLSMVGIVGIMTLALQIWFAFWDTGLHTDWRGIRPHVPVQIAAEWMVYMVLFVFLSLIVQVAWRLGCSMC